LVGGEYSRAIATDDQQIGDSWIANLEQLKQLESYAEDSAFRAQWRKVQHDVKEYCRNSGT
jgi:glucan phosphorylase